jgi:hypothetical protein
LLHVAYGYRGGAAAIAINARGAASTSIRAARVKSANPLVKIGRAARNSSQIIPNKSANFFVENGPRDPLT